MCSSRRVSGGCSEGLGNLVARRAHDHPHAPLHLLAHCSGFAAWVVGFGGFKFGVRGSGFGV